MCAISYSKELLTQVIIFDKFRKDISRRHHLFPREMTSEKQLQKFRFDGVSLSRSG